MKERLRDGLGPRVGSLLERLERGVTRDDHLATVARIVARPDLLETLPVEARPIAACLLGEGRRLLAGEPPRGAAPDVPASVPSPEAFREAARRRGPYESGGGMEACHLAGLLRLPDERSGAPPQGPLPEPGAEAERAGPPAREVAALNASLAVDGPDAEHVSELVAQARALPARRWFLRRGTCYGTGHLLLALLRVVPGPLAPYTREVCDRLVRHVEIRRRGALAFRPEGLPDGSAPAVERLRFAVALATAARCFGDLRYLNTALKLNDWHRRRLLPGRRSGTDSLAALHYVVSIARQESALREGLAP